VGRFQFLKGEIVAEKKGQQKLNDREAKLKKQLDDISIRKQIQALRDKLKKK